MKLTKAQKEDLLDLLSLVDVKKIELDHPNEEITKWFRFGSHNGLNIAKELIKAIDEETNKIPTR